MIALRAPVSKDLRAILTVMRIAASLERIGDYAKNMAKRTAVLVDMPQSAAQTQHCAAWPAKCRRCSKTRSTLIYGRRGIGRGRAPA